ncbi:MAG TPA: sugar ABC transporter permease, partial [Ktedonobacteraceae bacterium]|nr:sugar ABC transporter permease [Ktedonobacteraceae bacterium]
MATQAVEVPIKGQSLRERFDLGSGFAPYFLVLPTVAVILAVAAYPILNSLWQSLLDNPLSTAPSFVGLRNFVQLVGSSEFRGSIVTTFSFTIISVALETIFGLGIALLINGTFPGRGLVRASILVPWAFPTVISAQIWYLM